MHSRSTGMCAGFDSIRPVYYNYVIVRQRFCADCATTLFPSSPPPLTFDMIICQREFGGGVRPFYWRLLPGTGGRCEKRKKCIQFNSVTQPAQMSISHMFLRLLNRKVLIMRRGWRTSASAQAHRTADDTAADISNSWVKSLPPPSRLPFEFGICIWELVIHWFRYPQPVPMGGITWKFSAYSTTVGSFGLPSRNITERRGLFEGNLLIASWAPVFVVSSFACYNILFFFKRVYIRRRRRREGRIFLAPKKRKRKEKKERERNTRVQSISAAKPTSSFFFVFRVCFPSVLFFVGTFYNSFLSLSFGICV